METNFCIFTKKSWGSLKGRSDREKFKTESITGCDKSRLSNFKGIQIQKINGTFLEFEVI